MGLGLAGILAGLGLVFGFTGGGLIWVAKTDTLGVTETLGDLAYQLSEEDLVKLSEEDPIKPETTV